MGKGNLNIRGNMMHVFTVSFPEIIINGEFWTVPHTTKYFHTLGTAYLNRYRSIHNICLNRHKIAIIDIADANDITNTMSFSAGYNRMHTIPILSDRNTKYNPYNRLSRFK